MDRSQENYARGVLIPQLPPKWVDEESLSRFGEPFKFLPVIYVSCTIAYLYFSYTFLHCVPLLQLSEHEDRVDILARDRSWNQLVCFNVLTVLLLTCYVRSILVHPGRIPEGDSRWDYNRSKASQLVGRETKKTGDRRHCKWCGKYKPDRCHHCRQCKICILKMDHHCPWIYNCVGDQNYKYFFLLLVYCALTCHLILWTMADTVREAIMATPSAPSGEMFLLLFTETLTFFLATITTLFLSFHVWLALRALTTIEFCEKTVPKSGNGGGGYGDSPYNQGLWLNICATLGDNPFLWFLPLSPPAGGSGLDFLEGEVQTPSSNRSSYRTWARPGSTQEQERANSRAAKALLDQEQGRPQDDAGTKVLS